MNKTLFSLLTILGIAFSNAGTQATTLADNIGVSGGISVSNFTTDRGLAVREDSFDYSLSLTAPLAGGDFSIGLGLADSDDDTDASNQLKLQGKNLKQKQASLVLTLFSVIVKKLRLVSPAVTAFLMHQQQFGMS